MPRRTKRLTLTKRKPKKQLYEPLRQILDERRNKNGAVEYYIDWEPDQKTGREFEPTWEPASNVNQEAVDDWESKRPRDASASSSSGPSPRKRRRTDADVVVEIPSKPRFDPGEYARVASQTTIPDSQEPDSFPSVAATVGDGISDHSDLGLRSPSLHLSLEDFRHPSTRAPSLEVFQNGSRETPNLSESSHPEAAYLSFGERQVVTATNTQPSLTLPGEASAAEGTSSPGFLTQPEFGLETPPLETSPAASTTQATDAIADSNNPTSPSSHEVGSHDSQNSNSASATSHSAQVVPPSIRDSERLRTPSQLVIPASSENQRPQPSLAFSPANVARQSVPSGALVSDTPTRHLAPEGDNDSIARLAQQADNQTASDDLPVPCDKDSEIPVSLTPGPSPPEEAEPRARVSSLKTVSPEPSRRTSPESSLESLHRILGSVTPSEIRATPGMDQLPDLADGENLVEYLRALHASSFSTPSAERPKQDPAEVPDQESATLSSGDPQAASHAALNVEEQRQHLPETIAPSQLNMFVAGASSNHTVPPPGQSLFQSDAVEHETVLPGIESRQLSAEPGAESPASSVALSIGHGPNEFLVTLPMLASTRSLYIETLRSHKSAIAKYGAFFTTESGGNPDDQLISEVDDIFRRLHDHCDLPQFADSIPHLGATAMMKHATGTNSKFAFVYEFLKDLKDSNIRVLVLSQPGLAIDYLEAIFKAGEFQYTGLDNYLAVGDESEKLSVLLGTTEMGVFDRPLLGVDVVVLFDSLGREVWQDRASGAVVLSLVLANSIEHIELRLPDNLDDLERRSAMGFALAASQSVISDPRQMQEPDELALLFADFVKDPTHGLDWEQQSLPGHFFDFYPSSQAAESQRTAATAPANAGRKRVLDGDDDRQPTPTKRAKTARTTLTQASYLMSDLLKNALASYSPRPQGSVQTVEVPIDQLEWMAAKIARLEDSIADKHAVEERLSDVIKGLEGQLKSYQETVRTTQPKYMDALSERGTYELQMQAAEERAAKLQEKLDATKAEAAALESRLAAAQSSAEPPSDVEAQLAEARARLQTQDKKLKSTAGDLDYLRSRYQAASGSAAELAGENAELKARIKHLEHRASDVTVRLHEVNRAGQAADAAHRLDDARATLALRDAELDRVRAELRQLKNGRRETRQSSVPRSPRLGPGGGGSVMSPRTRGGNGAGNGGNSRGTSPAPFDGSSTPSSAAGPVPGMTFYQPPGSHPRFSHLRE